MINLTNIPVDSSFIPPALLSISLLSRFYGFLMSSFVHPCLVSVVCYVFVSVDLSISLCVSIDWSLFFLFLKMIMKNEEPRHDAAETTCKHICSTPPPHTLHAYNTCFLCLIIPSYYRAIYFCTLSFIPCLSAFPKKLSHLSSSTSTAVFAMLISKFHYSYSY